MKVITRMSRLISGAHLAAFVVGMLYVSGYYINSIFLKNFGIPDTELLRLEYIKVGFVFWLLTLGFVFLPLGSFMLTYKVRNVSGLPHRHIGAIGNALNTTLFLAYPLFLAFFVTRYEWNLKLSISIGPIHTVQQTVVIFIVLASLGVIVIPFIERIINKVCKSGMKHAMFWFIIEPLRYGIFALNFLIVYLTMSQIPWFSQLVIRGVYYLLSGLVFALGMVAAALWIRHIKNVRGGGLVYPLITFGLAILYYMAITSYVFGVYTFIPCNRGGRLPLTEAYLELENHSNILRAFNDSGREKMIGPVYIIEVNNDSIFFASDKMEQWTRDFVPIHVIRKELVPYIYLKRIDDGFPRVQNQSTGISRDKKE